MRTHRRVSAALSLAAGIGLLTACGLPAGPTGVVVAKADHWSPATHSRAYFLTVRTPQGERKEFQVHIDDYDHCPARAAYPACTKG
ncbi:DUF2500 domain-containing protein [Streptomyces sp. NBC_01281]|uniref:hypothetical protein n=1 Tax=unclassified Streptomyces TaxID=2593676 RepID=UPI002DDB6326|nr:MULTISPECIES: hypothetical protein [unclassified Streptomyces]WSD78978.1 DUF2500 domain-containing protein [Streptomyces sp. NBC_01558]WSK62085.1 DUF2500 domain-containing protein [Streptomyces sp. NBC_01281]